MGDSLHPLLVSLGQKPRKGTIKVCKQCGIEFYAGPCHSKRVFCSKRCSISWDKEKSFSFNCIMCGIKVFTQPSQIKNRNRKNCSRKCYAAWRTKKAEEDAKLFPPTEGLLRRRIRYSKKMDDWRAAVFQRDNWTCQFCWKQGGYLQADHIKPFATHPELRFELSNGRTLCKECHKKTPTFGGRIGGRGRSLNASNQT